MSNHQLSPYNQPTQRDLVNSEKVGSMMRRLVDEARANGISDEEMRAYIPDLVGAPAGQCGTSFKGSTVAESLGAQVVPWSPRLGACPIDLDRFLCWMMRATCSFNKFGQVGSSVLTTPTITLPDASGSFLIGPSGTPGATATPLGVSFPPEWAGEAAYRGIFRVKVRLNINVTLGALDPDDIGAALLEGLTFRIIQSGTEDPYTVALNFGEPQDAQSSTLIPSVGGYYLAEGDEFVPFALDPTIQAFDFAGQAPGQNGVDAYEVYASIRAYFRTIC